MSVTFDIAGRVWPYDPPDCECGHPWERHVRILGGYQACRHSGCPCHGVVPPPRSPPAAMFLNLANVNARTFGEWLGLELGECLVGEAPAREVAALCRRRLWPERREKDDPGVPFSDTKRPGQCRVIVCGRPPGRLAEYAERLLALAEEAGGGVITWW